MRDVDRRSRSPRSGSKPHFTRSRSPLNHTRTQRLPQDAKHRTALKLPFSAQPLKRHDLEEYKPMFALYLDIQKQKVLEDLPEQELKGRWKSFTGKW